MNSKQISLICTNINILTAWIDTLEFRLRHSFPSDEKPIQNEIANYKNLVFNLQTVLEIEKETSKALTFSLEVLKLLESLSRKTDQNDHNGSVLELAKFLKSKDSEKTIEAIIAKYEKLGHMVPVWIEERTVETMRLLEIAEFQYGKEIAKKISSCF
jgi:hypothetical protein